MVNYTPLHMYVHTHARAYVHELQMVYSHNAALFCCGLCTSIRNVSLRCCGLIRCCIDTDTEISLVEQYTIVDECFNSREIQLEGLCKLLVSA